MPSKQEHSFAKVMGRQVHIFQKAGTRDFQTHEKNSASWERHEV